MGGQPVGEPNETSIGPDGMVPPWQAVPPGNQQPMHPCHRCGAAFAAHLDGMCPQAGPGAENVTAPYWAGFAGTAPPYAYWAGPKPAWHHWPRRHPLLTGAVMLFALLLSIGTVYEVSQASGQTTSQATNGNAMACGAYWKLANSVGVYDMGDAAAGWQALEAAAPAITNPALSAAVHAFDEDLSSNDMFDAATSSTAIGTACTTLGYGNPG